LTVVTLMRRDGAVTPKKTAVRTSVVIEEDAPRETVVGANV
jgi:hypothetical protein